MLYGGCHLSRVEFAMCSPDPAEEQSLLVP